MSFGKVWGITASSRVGRHGWPHTFPSPSPLSLVPQFTPSSLSGRSHNYELSTCQCSDVGDPYGCIVSREAQEPTNIHRAPLATMTEQNGIDILCDAAGSDLLLSSLFHPSGPGGAGNPPSAAPATGAAQGLTQAQAQAEQSEDKSRAKRAKTDATPSSSIGASHVCHLCRRVYERADHLTRHMRSHENARQHQCSRCQKRFNRA